MVLGSKTALFGLCPFTVMVTRWDFSILDIFGMESLYTFICHVKNCIQVGSTTHLEDHARYRKWFCYPPFISHLEGVPQPYGWGRKLWLLTTYKSWDDPPSIQHSRGKWVGRWRASILCRMNPRYSKCVFFQATSCFRFGLHVKVYWFQFTMSSSDWWILW